MLCLAGADLASARSRPAAPKLANWQRRAKAGPQPTAQPPSRKASASRAVARLDACAGEGGSPHPDRAAERLLLRGLFVLWCLVLSPLGLWAQSDPPDPAATAKVHLGPVAIAPRIALSNLGIDTNVFNENEGEDPKQDFTMTVGPQADFWLRLGRARLSVKATLDYVYFATYSSERGFNTRDSARLELPMRHIRPWVGFSYLNTRERFGPELDSRARHIETAWSGGVDFPVSRKTTFGLSVREARTDFPEDEAIQDTYLRDVFNRTTTVGTASLRYALTPLTTIVMAGEVVRERFEFSPGRDSNGFRLVPGVEFDTSALIDGSARVGYRSLKMLTPGVPDYTGPVANVDLGYRLLGVTRFAISVRRDVDYSFEIVQPYYVLTGVTGSITQAVGGPWSLVARMGTQTLEYASVDLSALLPPGSAAGQLPGQPERTDRVRFWGGGIGYKLGPDARLGFDVNYYKRSAARERQDYTGLRAGTSVTYGF